MRVRVTLRSPLGGTVERDMVEGLWAEPRGIPDQHLGRESWALPGLVDAHAHLAAETLAEPGDLDGAADRARDALRSGLTLILDKGWGDDTTVRLIESVPDGERPEIEAAARIIAVEDGYFPDFAREIEPTDMAASVAEEAWAGKGWVKLIGDWPRKGRGPVANFDCDTLKTAVETAESLGARVAVHTMAREVPSVAVAAGVHSIEHGLFLTETDLELLGDRGGMWVPTIGRVEATIGYLGEGSSGGRLLTEGLDNVRRLLPTAVECGVHVLCGTDLVGSPSDVAAEAIELGRYGMTSSQVVAAVGTSAFTATGRPVDFPPGAPANAVLFAGNPVEDLAVLTAPEATIRLGVII